MVMWIIWAYLAASFVASLVIYAACVMAARADKMQQHLFTVNLARDRELDAQRTSSAHLVLTA